MMVRNLFGNVRAAGPWLAAVGLCLIGACSRDVRLAGRTIPHVTVGLVTVDGVRLDESAPPERVAYAALRAMYDDFRARTPADRNAALNRELDLCAADVIQHFNRTTLDRDEFVYNVVYRWTPTVSYYVDDFPKSWDEARKRLVVRPVAERNRIDPETDEVAVEMEVTPPDGDVNARVVLIVWLARDEGMWRVVHTGFDQKRRSIVATSARSTTTTPPGM